VPESGGTVLACIDRPLRVVPIGQPCPTPVGLDQLTIPTAFPSRRRLAVREAVA